MPSVSTSRSDVVWSYVGTAVSMASGFVLLPLLMAFLSDDELGLWYVYVAVANLAMLFEFGFNPTFARNIVFVLSGVRRLSSEGRDASSLAEGTDWHLLNVVICSSKVVYAAIALVALLLLSSLGTAYVARITMGMGDPSVWLSWAIFVVSVVVNLFFLYSITVLRGYGDIAGENKAKTFAKLAQLLVSAILLLCGFGLIGAAVGYFVNALLMRGFAIYYLGKHDAIRAGRKADGRKVSFSEVKDVLATISHVAWRDGVVRLALYCSTQATSIMSSLFLSLAETGTYSVLLQLATAVYTFASAYPKSFFPSMQSAFADGDLNRQRRIVSSGISAYWILIALGTIGVCLVIMPLLPLFKSEFSVDLPLYLGMTLYLALLQQHSIFCNYVISMNEIPYMRGYLVAAFTGVGLVWLFCSVCGWGAWGIVLGQAFSQAVYNNWRWPRYLCEKLNTRYPALIGAGFAQWRGRLVGALRLH